MSREPDEGSETDSGIESETHSEAQRGPGTGTAIPLAPAKVFEALSNRRRRLVLCSLSRTRDDVRVGDVAIEIAAIENGVAPDQVTHNQRASVYIALTQRHLPKLDEIGAVAYNDRSKEVGPTNATGPLARFIRELKSACYDPDGESPA